MNILISALSGIGDALMFTPSINFLRSVFPDARIDALVMYKAVKDLYERINQINNVIYFPFLSAGKVSSLKQVISLRGEYDVTINVYPANRKEYNLISFLIGAKKRAAIEYLRSDRKELGWLNNVRVKEDDSVHNVVTNIKLCEALSGQECNEIGKLIFPIKADDRHFAEDFIRKNSLVNSKIIGFHAGCSKMKNHVNRRWAPEKFAELANLITKNNDYKVLLFGGPEDEGANQIIYNLTNHYKVIRAKTTNLLQTAALIKRCEKFVTNDSALMHTAAAMEVDTVCIIGPTNINYIYPWQTKHEVVTLNLECSPCFFYSPKPLTCYRDDLLYKCVKEIDVDFVFNKLNLT